MKYLSYSFAVALLMAYTLPAMADRHSHRDFSVRGERMILDRFDEDNDGKISLEEFDPPRVMPIHEIDTDEDGVSIEELIDHRQKTQEDHIASMFEKLDLDGDGRVTAEEAKASVFAQLDSNEDGYLSPHELRPRMDRRHGRAGHALPHAMFEHARNMLSHAQE